jgi:Gamma tubulin complex component C-terminal
MGMLRNAFIYIVINFNIQLVFSMIIGMVEGALRSSNAQYDPSFILDRIGVRLLEATPGDTGWEVFSLDYKVDAPINAVVSFPILP